MRKAHKQEVLEFINSLHQAHMEVKEALQRHNYDAVQNMLSECQEFAVTLGENIEKSEGEGHVTVSHVEEYCETLFRAFQDITDGQANENRIYKMLRRQLLAVENSVKNDIPVKKEIAFFPYKASMWDSLESVYLAAKEDPECDAYCVPIPYFDLNPDHTVGKMHYEGDQYPANINITDWRTYNFEERKPDVIYFHNPYDEWNLVTRVHPRYYSSNLKKYTDTLVYIPYYVTSGGMMEAQDLLPAYLYADYIVIQSPQFRKHFDKSIPDEKFLPFGSPKIDKVINKCKNPPEPPEEWIRKMTGKGGKRKRVFFYNTSINGMLADTEAFLKKMQYVFSSFEKREDACILWRPHPLLEATFLSMRPQYWSEFVGLKEKFLDKGIGILDTTADIEDSIALSDAYIGDAGTSVTALFGVAGKPLFILNNMIHEEPKEDSWREEIVINYSLYDHGRFVITQGNKLYVSEPEEFRYNYFCDLAEYSSNIQYSIVYEINGKLYACPDNAQDILVIGKDGVEKSIKLEERVKRKRLFSLALKYNKYLILIPLYYPAVVRFDTETEQVCYFEDYIDVFVRNIDGKNIIGDAMIHRGELYIASPVDNLIYKLHIESGRIEVVELPIESRCGGFVLSEYRDEIWIMPYEGKVIVRWNLLTGEVREYSDYPEGFSCANSLTGGEGPAFNIPAFYGEYMYLATGWANMYLKLNICTGEFSIWQPSFEENEVEKQGFTNEKSTFMPRQSGEVRDNFKLYSNTRRKIYCIDNIETAECKEKEIQFDIEELKRHETGFGNCSATLQYACIENCFNSLNKFLDGEIAGVQYDKQKQLAVYSDIVTNYDGSCGRKVYEYINGQI